MKRNDLIFLARLRLLVGFLGEQNHFNWWNCSFFSPSSKSFLAPVYGKTLFLAQYYGVQEAAIKVHDNYIGVGRGVFHSFRLPESIEQKLHAILCAAEIANQLADTLKNAFAKQAGEITGLAYEQILDWLDENGLSV